MDRQCCIPALLYGEKEMSKIKKFFNNWKIWVYLIFFVFTLFAINPNPWNKGVAIRTVVVNSTAYNAGMVSPNPQDAPMTRERILEVNRISINSVSEFKKLIFETR